MRNQYTISQKQSGTGCIHDIASSNYDRVVTFAPHCKYAVVLASYYGGKGYTTHRTAKAVLRAVIACQPASYKIIDRLGIFYVLDNDQELQVR